MIMNFFDQNIRGSNFLPYKLFIDFKILFSLNNFAQYSTKITFTSHNAINIIFNKIYIFIQSFETKIISRVFLKGYLIKINNHNAKDYNSACPKLYFDYSFHEKKMQLKNISSIEKAEYINCNLITPCIYYTDFAIDCDTFIFKSKLINSLK